MLRSVLSWLLISICIYVVTSGSSNLEPGYTAVSKARLLRAPAEQFRQEHTNTAEVLLDREEQLHPAVGRGGWIQLCCISICSAILGLVFSHVVVASITGNVDWPLPTLRGNDNHKEMLQVALLGFWILLMMDTGMLIPTSYELAQAMKTSASASGTFLGCGYLATPAGSIFAAYLFRTCSQRTARFIGLIGVFMLTAQNLFMALLLDSRDDHGPETMWTLITIRILLGLGRVAYIVQYMAYNVTTREGRTRLSILVAMAINAGMCLGPYLSAIVIHLLGGRESVPSVYSRTSAIMYVMAALWAVWALVFAISMPCHLKFAKMPRPEDAELSRDAEAQIGRFAKCTQGDRKSIVAHALHFCMNRALASSAIEAGSALILETSFEWGSRATGFSISAVFGVTVVMCGLTLYILSLRIVKDVNCLMFFMGISCVGSLLLLNAQHGHALQLLIADILIYPSLFCANGIVDGIVTSLSVQDTWYSVESYLSAKSLQGIPRFIAFPLTRHIIDCCGIVSYAKLLIVFGILATASSCTIAWKAEWKAVKEGEASKSLMVEGG